VKLKIIASISAIIILFIISCENDQSIEFKRYYSTGAAVYQTHCQNCHGSNGEGLSALIPSLTDTTYLKKNKNALACFVKYGLKKEVTIKSRLFNEVMPANDLSPMEIAQVLTYIGNSFNNKLNTIDLRQTEDNLAGCK
jgi:mono/diheme cytochrome c family protein